MERIARFERVSRGRLEADWRDTFSEDAPDMQPRLNR